MSGSATPSPRVPGFELHERVGSGGFSTVYRAYDSKFDRVVAIKLLNVAMSDPAAQRRFLRECRLMGRLGSHPHVLTVFAADVLEDDRPYIVMEFLEGGTIAERAPLPQPDVLRAGILVGSALASVHAADVVHRDVKPQNILLSGYGQPVLGDFGVSGVIDQGGAVSNPMALSPLYAAPEAFHGLPDASSDQYSLAATLYALLAGRSPAAGDDEEPLTRIMLRVLEDAPRPLGPDLAHPWLWATLDRALAKDGRHRFPDVTAFVTELQAVEHELGLPVTAAVGTSAGTSSPKPLGGAARVTTRPPLGSPGVLPRPPVADVAAEAGTQTRPAAWPDAPPGVDPPAGGPDAAGASRHGPSPPESDGDVRPGPGGPPTDVGETAPRRGVLAPVLALVVVGIVLALVVTVLLGADPEDDASGRTTAPPTTEPDPTVRGLAVAPSQGSRFSLMWEGAPAAEYRIYSYVDRPELAGLPTTERRVTGPGAVVTTEEDLGTCFFVVLEEEVAAIVGSDEVTEVEALNGLARARDGECVNGASVESALGG